MKWLCDTWCMYRWSSRNLSLLLVCVMICLPLTTHTQNMQHSYPPFSFVFCACQSYHQYWPFNNGRGASPQMLYFNSLSLVAAIQPSFLQALALSAKIHFNKLSASGWCWLSPPRCFANNRMIKSIWVCDTLLTPWKTRWEYTTDHSKLCHSHRKKQLHHLLSKLSYKGV